MDLKPLYNALPNSMRPVARRAYLAARLLTSDKNCFFARLSQQPRPEAIEAEFVEKFIHDRETYKQYKKSFRNSAAGEVYERHGMDYDAIALLQRERKRAYDDHTEAYWQAIKLLEGQTLYCLMRAIAPDTVVETGVANGWSSVCILAGLNDAGGGKLHSIDVAFRADTSKQELLKSEYNVLGNSKIPADEDPGWLVPDSLKQQWQLHTGRSQTTTPTVLGDLGTVDVFQHDSEHSTPCMMMEYELAWEHLSDGGVLLSDDTDGSFAWHLFIDEREAKETGLIAYPNQGYAVK